MSKKNEIGEHDTDEMCIVYIPVPCPDFERRFLKKTIMVSKEEYFLVPENCRTMEGFGPTAKYYVLERVLRKIQLNNSLSKIIEQKPQKIRRRM